MGTNRLVTNPVWTRVVVSARLSVGLSLAGAAPVLAQSFIKYDLRIRHDVLLPGQAQTVEVWASFTPFPKKVAPDITSIAMGRIEFDLINEGGFENGTIDNVQGQSVFWSKLGEPDPDGSLIRGGAWQPANFPESYIYDNPIHVITFDWTPNPGSKHGWVQLSTAEQAGYWREIIAFFGVGHWPQYDYFTVDVVHHDTATWQVLSVPAPGSAVAMMALAGLARARRWG